MHLINFQFQTIRQKTISGISFNACLQSQYLSLVRTHSAGAKRSPGCSCISPHSASAFRSVQFRFATAFADSLATASVLFAARSETGEEKTVKEFRCIHPIHVSLGRRDHVCELPSAGSAHKLALAASPQWPTL